MDRSYNLNTVIRVQTLSVSVRFEVGTFMCCSTTPMSVAENLQKRQTTGTNWASSQPFQSLSKEINL